MKEWERAAQSRGFNAGYAIALGGKPSDDHLENSMKWAEDVATQHHEIDFNRKKAEGIYLTAKERWSHC